MGGGNIPDFEPLLRSSSSRSNGRVGFEMHVKQGVFLQCAMVFVRVETERKHALLLSFPPTLLESKTKSKTLKTNMKMEITEDDHGTDMV
jgi:hypothetical protein